MNIDFDKYREIEGQIITEKEIELVRNLLYSK